MNQNPFFTALDPDARLKGSRDPLGFESLDSAWPRGGWEFDDSNAVGSPVQHTPVCFYFANKAVELMANGQEQFLPAFLRFEQLAAYSRCAEKSARSDVRSIRAVTRNIGGLNGSLKLSLRADSQILSDQKTYGTARTQQHSANIRSFAGIIWGRNRQTDVVNFTLDRQNRLIGRVDQPAETLDSSELFFYLTRLAVECDRMEYLLTGENRF